MKKYLIILLLLTGAFFQTQLFSYSGEKVGDIKCSEINSIKRYQNLSPSIITKIDLIGDKINNKYTDKDNTYKEKIYNLYIKVLNQYLEKTQYSEVQKEVLLRIGDYFVCKKEGLINKENLDVYNVKVLDITDHSAKVIWEGNSEAQTWLYVKRNKTTGIKHNATNNSYIYPSLGSGYEFILYIQGKGSSEIKKIDFKTLDKEVVNNTQPIPIDDNDGETTIKNTINKYLEEVNLPKCDANNPEVQFIKTNDDWKHINDKDKRIFCVSPGYYRALKNIILTTSGTKEKRRYIVLNNGNDIHPGKLPKEEIANYKLRLDGANYWIIDRPVTIKYGGEAILIDKNSSYNIINRMYTNNVASSVTIRHNSHNNTIQNSRFDDGSDPGYDGPVCVAINDRTEKYVQIHNTKVINNEFYNQNDSFQIVRSAVSGLSRYQDVNAEGTIVDGNKFYKDVPYMENAFDIKAGSDNPNNPIIISNNIMWGYKQHPDYKRGSYGPGRTAIMGHIGPKNVYIFNNVIFDSAEAIRIGDNAALSGIHGSLIDGKIENNIFYECGNTKYKKMYATFIASSRNLKMNNNYYISSRYKEGKIYGNYNGGSFNNNKVVFPYNGKSTFEGYPGYSNSFQSGINSTKTVSNKNWKDFKFTWGEFTNNPKKIILPKILDPNGSIVSRD